MRGSSQTVTKKERKRPPVKTSFKPGSSGNPTGRPKLTPEEKAVKALTRETWNELSQKMMTCDKSELEALLAEKVPYEVELFIRHMLALGERPDWQAYEKYLARRIGPVKQEVEITAPKPTVIKRLGSGEEVVLGVSEEKE